MSGSVEERNQSPVHRMLCFSDARILYLERAALADLSSLGGKR